MSINIKSLDLTKLEPKKPVAKHWLQETVGIFGMPKAGKSSLVAEMPHTLIINTEREEAYSHVETDGIFKIEINSWIEFKQVIQKLNMQPHNFKTVVVDTIGALHVLCRDAVLKAYGWKDASEGPKGGGYTKVREAFKKTIGEFIAMESFGCVFVAHAGLKEIGGEKNRSAFSFEDKELPGWLKTLCTTIIHVGESVINFRDTPHVEAGTRRKLKEDSLKVKHKNIKDTFKMIEENFQVEDEIIEEVKIEETKEIKKEGEK